MSQRSSISKKVNYILLGVVVALFVTAQSFGFSSVSKTISTEKIEQSSASSKDNDESKSEKNNQTVSEAVSSSSQASFDTPNLNESNSSEENQENYFQTFVQYIGESVSNGIQKVIQNIVSPNAP